MFLAEKNRFGEYSLSSAQRLHSPERELTLRLWSMYYNTPTQSWLGAHESGTYFFEQMVAQRVGPVTVTVIVLCAFACLCAVWPVSSCLCTANRACCTLIWQSRASVSSKLSSATRSRICCSRASLSSGVSVFHIFVQVCLHALSFVVSSATLSRISLPQPLQRHIR